MLRCFPLFPSISSIAISLKLLSTSLYLFTLAIPTLSPTPEPPAALDLLPAYLSLFASTALASLLLLEPLVALELLLVYLSLCVFAATVSELAYLSLSVSAAPVLAQGPAFLLTS